MRKDEEERYGYLRPELRKALMKVDKVEEDISNAVGKAICAILPVVVILVLIYSLLHTKFF